MTDDLARLARRRTATVLTAVAAALLVLVAVVAGLLVALGHRDSPAAQPTSGDPVRPAASPTGPTMPILTANPTTSATADQLSWVTVAGARVPVSATAGPRDTTEGRARGFAHTPTGAVLAAAHISVRLSAQAGPSVFDATLREQVVGADAAALGRHLAEDYQAARAQLGLPYGEPAGRLYSTIRGYQLGMDDADAATVRLLIEGPGRDSGSVLVAVRTRLQWTGADWALVAPSGGDWTADAALITDTTGFIRFPDGG